MISIIGFPTDKNSLIALPGIGEYTSSAIMAIAFDRKSNVIDGNVERVFSRFYAVEKPIKESKIFIKNISKIRSVVVIPQSQQIWYRRF